MKHNDSKNTASPNSLLMTKRILPLVGDLLAHYRRIYRRWDGLGPQRKVLCEGCGWKTLSHERDECCQRIIQKSRRNCPPELSQPEIVQFICPMCGAKDSFVDC